MNIMSLLFSFEGRIGRLAYWGAYVANFVMFIAVGMALGLGDMAVIDPATGAMESPGGGTGLVLLGVSLVSIWIALAINVKRFHDRDKSGWWVLIGLVPVIGGLWILIECGFLAGTAGTNRFGAPT